jgi:hypothetical protein
MESPPEKSQQKKKHDAMHQQEAFCRAHTGMLYPTLRKADEVVVRRVNQDGENHIE